MTTGKFILGIVITLCGLCAMLFVLSSEHTLVMHPKGIIAESELELIITNVLLMLVIIVPTYVLLYVTVWRSQAKNAKEKFNPDHSHGMFGSSLQWVLPSLIVLVMSFILWDAAHELDPYKPLQSEAKPLTIQVVALDWKWLFIYPEQGIATVNFVQFPEKTPIHFTLSADGTPMNSFWIPQLSGQIYTMTGMITQIHMMAHAPGEYKGKAAEINGAGYSDMTFVAKSTTKADFDGWVDEVKHAPLKLYDQTYNELVKRSIKHPVTLYSDVKKELFEEIVMKPMNGS